MYILLASRESSLSKQFPCLSNMVSEASTYCFLQNNPAMIKIISAYHYPPFMTALTEHQGLCASPTPPQLSVACSIIFINDMKFSISALRKKNRRKRRGETDMYRDGGLSSHERILTLKTAVRARNWSSRDFTSASTVNKRKCS